MNFLPQKGKCNGSSEISNCAGVVVTESSGTTSPTSRIPVAVQELYHKLWHADIGQVNDEEPFADRMHRKMKHEKPGFLLLRDIGLYWGTLLSLMLVHQNLRNIRNIYRSSPVSKCSGGMVKSVSLNPHPSSPHEYGEFRANSSFPQDRNKNPVEPKKHTHKNPGSEFGFSNGIGQRFSLNKSSAVHEKPHTPRSYLRWKPTGRIFKTVSLRWIPTGKVFIDSTTKVDSEPPNGSNDDITNPYECNQTLYVSAGTSNSSAGTSVNPLKERLGVWLPKRLISHTSGVQGIQI
ncbi:hypothetical protein Tco_0844061 [Tanacetum coccineum]